VLSFANLGLLWASITSILGDWLKQKLYFQKDNQFFFILQNNSKHLAKNLNQKYQHKSLRVPYKTLETLGIKNIEALVVIGSILKNIEGCLCTIVDKIFFAWCTNHVHQSSKLWIFIVIYKSWTWDTL